MRALASVTFGCLLACGSPRQADGPLSSAPPVTGSSEPRAAHSASGAASAAPSHDARPAVAPAGSDEPTTPAPPATAWPSGLDDGSEPYVVVLARHLMSMLGLSYDQKCATGWTGSVDLELADGKIVSLSGVDQKPRPVHKGKPVPPIPAHLAPYLRGRLLVGLCAAYVHRAQ